MYFNSEKNRQTNTFSSLSTATKLAIIGSAIATIGDAIYTKAARRNEK